MAEGNEKIIETLEKYMDTLANVSMEEQKNNPILMLIVIDGLKAISSSLFILYKTRV